MPPAPIFVQHGARRQGIEPLAPFVCPLVLVLRVSQSYGWLPVYVSQHFDLGR